MDKLDMASIPFNSFQFVFSFGFDFSFGVKVQMCNYSCLQFSKCGQVTGYRLKEWDFGCRMVSIGGSIQNKLRILEKIGSNPMVLALGLRGFFATSLRG